MLGRKKVGFAEALTGIGIAFREESNFKIQIGLGILVLAAGWFFRISPVEWLIVIVCIGFVLSAEVFNTALEEFCDMYKSDPDPHIAKIKDLAAGAVLIASIAAFIIGIIIFLPYIADTV
ncbi:diacylglycerol kinase family protein [Candidatus Kaiserbacteria bacterium]|nr:diacylglycerol kinase family protein [Candidatus Kaiserbacteria bacterium]